MKNQKWKRLGLVFLAGMVILHGALFWQLRDRVLSGYGDFTILYSAGRIVASGLGHQLYDPKVQYRTQLEFAPRVAVRRDALPYNHPPFEALVFVPLAELPYRLAYITWTLVNLLVLIFIYWRLRRQVPLLEEHSVGVWLLASLGYFPVFIALLQGQDILLLLLLYALVYVALKRGADVAAGCWLGLGLFRPQEVLPLLVILLFWRRWKVLAGFTAMAVALGIVSVATIGWRETLAYPGFVWTTENTRNGVIAPVDMPNLRGLASLMVGTLGARWENVLAAGLSVAAVLSAGLIWKPKSGQERFDLSFALAVVATLLASYHAYPYDLSVLLVAMALVVNGAWGKVGGLKILLGVPVLLLFFSPLHLFLWLRWQMASLMALVLVAWAIGISREIKTSANGIP
jgi:hypothetical protein